MSIIVALEDVQDEDRQKIGGKSFALSVLARQGLNIPRGFCISIEAYNDYVEATGLRSKIFRELNRKNLNDMRWEEVWDTALRIRSLFRSTEMPSSLYDAIAEPLTSHFSGQAVAVRSSAPGEDSSKGSFAGLHASYLNARDTASMMAYIQLVWSSLWSDAALLYRRELGLDVERSAMAVLVQEIVPGKKSGVVFGKNPNDESQAVVEAVYGLNQGLVDGTIEPDRWILDRISGRTLSHHQPKRRQQIMPAVRGVHAEALPAELQDVPPLQPDELNKVFNAILQAEKLFGAPQDVEWTWKDDELYLLQSRPITTLSSGAAEDKRVWYLGLRKSFDFLVGLRDKVENRRLPAMEKIANELAGMDLSGFSDDDLCRENDRRASLYREWHDIYWKEFIPLAHGIRLFGMTYNDRMEPADPYEFMELLTEGKIESLERNRMLEEMAEQVRKEPRLAEQLKEGSGEDTALGPPLEQFMKKYGDIFAGAGPNLEARQSVLRLVLEMATPHRIAAETAPVDHSSLEQAFFSAFPEEEKDYARELLDLGRSSYRLRDDDNIYMGKIKGQWLRIEEEMGRRFPDRRKTREDGPISADLFDALNDPTKRKEGFAGIETRDRGFTMKARQIVGQPAGPGISQGKARVIQKASDLFAVKAGEILICDAVDPNMTFVVPLTAGIVERRGGMLIHGAIIAREYGLPCVTGVSNATALIHTGDPVTVDGYLGIVVVG